MSTVEARARITTSPSPGSGRATSSIWTTSGGPYRGHTAALIRAPIGEMPGTRPQVPVTTQERRLATPTRRPRPDRRRGRCAGPPPTRPARRAAGRGRGRAGGVEHLARLVEQPRTAVEAHRLADGRGVQLGEHDPQLLDGAQAAGQPAVRHEGHGLALPRRRAARRSPASATPGTSGCTRASRRRCRRPARCGRRRPAPRASCCIGSTAGRSTSARSTTSTSRSGRVAASAANQWATVSPQRPSRVLPDDDGDLEVCFGVMRGP